jgi:SP family general alpha glucoside:H+ symporter-like MFS transporter
VRLPQLANSGFHQVIDTPVRRHHLWISVRYARHSVGLGNSISFVGNRRRCRIYCGYTRCSTSGQDCKCQLAFQKSLDLYFFSQINGIALGFFITLGPAYVSEIAPIPLRSPLISTVNFFITAGQFLAIGIGNDRFPIITPDSYKLIFAIQWVFPGIMLLVVFFLPESPWYLVKKGKSEEAARSLTRLHNASYDVAGALAEIELAVQTDRENSLHQRTASFLECFQGSDLRRTRIACGMFIIQQISGIAFYSQGLYFLSIAGLNITLAFRLTLMGFGLGLVSNVLGWVLMTYYGRYLSWELLHINITLTNNRRPIILLGIVLNFALLVAIGAAGCFSGSKALLFIGIAVNLANLFYAPTIGATTWAVSAEISSPKLRQKTQSLCTSTNALTSWVFSFITPYLINNDEANLGGKAAFVWAGCCVLGLVWVWFELPETKGRSFVEFNELFERKTATRAFKHTEIDYKIRETK